METSSVGLKTLVAQDFDGDLKAIRKDKYEQQYWEDFAAKKQYDVIQYV
jgi:hypothetical protein